MPTIQPAYEGSEKYIFISYAHKDKEEVYPVIARMQEEGYCVWYDEGIKPASEYSNYLANRIKECSCFIAFVSKKYIESAYCINELEYAYLQRRDRLLVFLEEAELPPGVELQNSVVFHLNKYVYDSFDEFYYSLLKVLMHKECRNDKQDNHKTIQETDEADSETTCLRKSIKYDGGMYFGEIKDGKPHGKGKIIYPSNKHYEGCFLNGKPHGKGKFTWANGTVYEGDFLNGKAHGIGKKTYPDGRVEEGRWENGEFLGASTQQDLFISKEQKTMPTIQPAYTGTEKYIFISYSHKDADEVYPVIARLQEEGYRIWYDEGNKCGDDFNKKIAAHIKKCYCFITLMSENYLASEYCIDELTYSYNKVNNRFFIFLQDVVLPDDIELRNAKYHHLFKYKYDSDESFFSELLESDNIKPCKGPVSAFSKDGEYYEGDMLDGKRHGRGILYMVSGNVYEGDFENGKPHCKGRFTWANGDVYEGDWVNGEREGKGVLTKANGDIYRGDFTDGKITGKGRYEWAHGSIYEGDFLDGMRDGKGKFTWNYGDVYEGNYVKDLRRGKGKFTYANGEVYEGEFKDNKMHGEGKYTWPDGRYYEGQYDKDLRSGKGHLHWNDGDYEGDFYDNKRHGYGKYTLNTGSVYEGEWDNDKRSGSGTYKFGNGNTYEGRFIDGKISGQGTFTWANGDVYEGSFQDGMRHGKGKFTSKDGKIILNGMWKNDEFTSDDFIYLKPIEAVSARSGSSVEHRAEEAAFATETDSQEPTCKHIVTEPIDFDGGKYVGEVRNGKPHGKGNLTWLNGNIYEGDFVNGKRTGQGKFTWADGTVYEGDFKNNKIHGKGKLTLTSGEYYEGCFKDGRRSGFGRYTIKDGSFIEGEWENDVFVG